LINRLGTKICRKTIIRHVLVLKTPLYNWPLLPSGFDMTTISKIPIWNSINIFFKQDWTVTFGNHRWCVASDLLLFFDNMLNGLFNSFIFILERQLQSNPVMPPVCSTIIWRYKEFGDKLREVLKRKYGHRHVHNDHRK
jgi:hypothetical protein